MIDFPSLSFFLAAVPAVMLVGLSKGGIGGAIGLMGVLIMSPSVGRRRPMSPTMR